MPTCSRLGQTCPLQPPSHRSKARLPGFRGSPTPVSFLQEGQSRWIKSCLSASERIAVSPNSTAANSISGLCSEGDQACEGPHCGGRGAQAWPLPALAHWPWVTEGHSLPLLGVQRAQSPSQLTSQCLPSSRVVSLGLCSLGLPGAVPLPLTCCSFPISPTAPAEPRDAGEQEFSV